MAAQSGDVDTSSDDSVLDETDEGPRVERSTRSTEGIEWCAVEDEVRSSVPSRNWSKVNYGNPKLGTKMQLFSRTNYYLGVYPDSTVRGTQDPEDLHTYLELKNTGLSGHVFIQGISTELYTAMSSDGTLYATSDSSNAEAVFVETITSSNYNSYSSKRMKLSAQYTECMMGDGLHGNLENRTLPKSVQWGRTHLELINAGYPGHVRIQGILSRLYVAMNKKGRLYAEDNMWKEATIFIESLEGSYNSYLSRANAHLGWYLAIKKSGKAKKGPKTSHRQKAALFLPVRRKFE